MKLEGKDWWQIIGVMALNIFLMWAACELLIPKREKTQTPEDDTEIIEKSNKQLSKK